MKLLNIKVQEILDINFLSIVYSSNIISANCPAQTEIPFFHEVNESSDSIVNAHEEKIVKWLLNNQAYLNILCESIGIYNEAIVFNHLQYPIIKNMNEKPGDIDILITSKKYPNESIAIECKRIFIKAIDSDNEYIQRKTVRNLKKGKEQAECYYKLGFQQVYLMILILVDGRNNKGYNMFARGASNSAFNKIHSRVCENMPDNCGVIYSEVIQNTDTSIDNSGMITVGLFRKAKLQQQPPELSQNIEKLLKMNNFI